MTSENFLKRLDEEENKVAIFVVFYIHLFGKTEVNLYALFNKLLKAYSYRNIFFSLLECYDMENISLDRPYGIISYFCKQRLLKDIPEKKYKSLEEFRMGVLQAMKERPVIQEIVV